MGTHGLIRRAVPPQKLLPYGKKTLDLSDAFVSQFS